ncbi:hypothetical protein [Helicobacter canis]|uniref:hypothetical protein n=1 Tax=Helicobacter canis TaxID=29419 RepID=UPI0026EA6D50|nr:hypothetical protein [Helicobacter canis]
MRPPRAQLGGRIFELESWLCKPRKEIRLRVYRHSASKQSAILTKKPTPKLKR